MPSYPSTLVQPNSASYSLEPKKNKEEFVSEFGNRRQRRFVTPQVYVVTLRFDLKNKAEYDAFLKWVKYDIDYGNLWFAADFLANEGFTEGEWVWKFVKMSYSATGYSMGFACTMLMAPRYSNIVSDDYVELGIEGSFFNPAIDFECEDLTFERIFNVENNYTLGAYEFNGSNWTKFGTSLVFSGAGNRPQSIACLRQDYIAVIMGDSATLKMYHFDGTSFTQLGTTFTLTGYSSTWGEKTITRMSDSRIALVDGSLKTLSVWEFNYGSNTWIQIGSSFSLTSYLVTANSYDDSITCLSETRIAFLYNYVTGGGYPNGTRLITFDFNGSTWSAVGSYLQIANKTNVSDPSTGTGNHCISAISSTEVALNTTISGNAYHRKITTFTFNGSTWTAGTPSATITANINNCKLVTLSNSKVALESGTYLSMQEFDSGSWIYLGNTLSVTVSSIAITTSFFEPV